MNNEHEKLRIELEKIRDEYSYCKRKLAYLESIIDRVPGNIYWKDKNGIYMGCNQNVVKMVGETDKNYVLGKKDSELPWKSYADKLELIDNAILLGNKPSTFEENPTCHDRKERVFLTTKSPLYNEKNEIDGIIGVSIDITEKKEVERELLKSQKKAEAANEAKSEFIANMSHDLRTPITGMVGMIQHIIRQSEKLEKTTNNRKIINMINEDSHLLMEATEELLKLFNQILETMNLESGELIEDDKSFKLSSTVEHNINLLSPVAKDKNIELSCSIDGSLPMYFKGLHNCLDRVLLNLLTNALKFTDSGFVKVSVGLLNQSKNSFQVGDQLTLKFDVEDSGKGIPEDKIDTIFELFTRLTPSYEGVYKGAGMGLNTVKKYLEKMSGDIAVTSEVGKGTCFTVTVPLIVSDHSDIIEQPRCFEKRKLLTSVSDVLERTTIDDSRQ